MAVKLFWPVRCSALEQHENKKKKKKKIAALAFALTHTVEPELISIYNSVGSRVAVWLSLHAPHQHYLSAIQ